MRMNWSESKCIEWNDSRIAIKGRARMSIGRQAASVRMLLIDVSFYWWSWLVFLPVTSVKTFSVPPSIHPSTHTKTETKVMSRIVFERVKYGWWCKFMEYYDDYDDDDYDYDYYHLSLVTSLWCCYSSGLFCPFGKDNEMTQVRPPFIRPYHHPKKRPRVLNSAYPVGILYLNMMCALLSSFQYEIHTNLTWYTTLSLRCKKLLESNILYHKRCGVGAGGVEKWWQWILIKCGLKWMNCEKELDGWMDGWRIHFDYI